MRGGGCMKRYSRHLPKGMQVWPSACRGEHRALSMESRKGKERQRALAIATRGGNCATRPLLPASITSLSSPSSPPALCNIAQSLTNMTNDPQTPLRPEGSRADQGTSSPSLGRSQSRHLQQAATDASSLNTPVSSSKFYGADKAGSSHTGYLAPASTPYREPQLVDDAPALSRSSQTAQDTIMADWSAEQSSASAWGPATLQGNNWPDSGSSQGIQIDGRDMQQELHWFNPSDNALPPRPGPGILPPLLADQLHDPNHALYSAIATVRSPSNAPRLAPSLDETRTAIPHAQSYYCPGHNGWVLLLWGNATTLPPLVRQIDNLPDAARRKQTSSCVGDVEPFGKMNATHHWHHYPKAVDSRKLTTPYERDEDTLLDLYLCCQCSTYCMVSDVLPGVIPENLHRAFTRDKFTNPPVDRTPKASVLAGWETILT